MGTDRLRIETDEQRRRLQAAREHSGLCVGCGRALGPGEPVYIERVEVERKPLAAPGAHWGQRPVYRDAPLGAECASSFFLDEARGRPPEECVGCGRPVYYEVGRWRRQRASCSRYCHNKRIRMEH
jgi:hypothetical protein